MLRRVMTNLHLFINTSYYNYMNAPANKNHTIISIYIN